MVRLVPAAATILFGALPATYLCLLPAALIVRSIQLFLDGGILPGLTGLLYGLTALFGTLCLWLVPFTVRNPVVITGLVAGMLVISPITYSAIFKPWFYDREAWLYTAATVLPFVVALTWLVYFAINRRSEMRNLAADEID